MNISTVELLDWLVKASYLVAATLFLLGLQRMASPLTARSGIRWAGLGMLLATAATFLLPELHNVPLILLALLLGAGLAWWSAGRVAITDMPQMVALYNGMGGGSAAAIGAVELLRYAFLAHRDTTHWSAQALADLAARQPSGTVLLLAVVTTPLTGLTDNFWLWLVLRFIGGVSSIAGLRGTPGVEELVEADIEQGPWPFPGRTFDAVLVTNYLWRPLLPTMELAPSPLLSDVLPLAGALAALLMAIAIRCRSVKEAQANATVVVLLVSLLPLLTLFGRSGEAPWHLWMPVLAQTTLMARVLKGESMAGWELLLPLVVCTLLGALCLAFVARTLRHSVSR